MIKLFYSNRIEQLYQNLKQQLFANTSPFERRLVIVPTPAIKSWLLLQFAKDPEVGIAAGLEFLYLEEGLKKIYDLIAQEKKTYHVPSSLELTLGIENQIRTVITEWSFLSSYQRDVWKPLMHYLKIHFDSNFQCPALSKRNEKRLASLSETLAKLFVEYSRYGKAMIDSWPKEEIEWQQALWHRLFSPQTLNWNFPSLTYQNLKTQTVFRPLQLHLFSVSFLPRSEYELFEKASEQIPVHYYSISPSCVFWSDTLTDKEASKLQKFWNKKGISLTQQQTLESYLQNKNPLLANWGKLGRKMTEQLEQTDAETFSHYQIPAKFEKEETDVDFDIDFSCEEVSPQLLHHLQADILFMRNTRENGKISLNDIEESIQLHSAPTIHREIEILYNNILYLFQKDKSLEPGEIIVMAPDIMSYAPAIRQIFGDENSQLDFQMMDIQSLSEDSLIKQFWHLINLSFSRWNSEDLMSLFEFPSFQKKHQFLLEDIFEIRSWLDEVEIKWGNDADHRNELLQQRHCQSMVENTNAGTWEGGFSQFLNSLVMQNGSFSGLEANQGILLGKWMELIRSLRKDLQQLSSGQLRTYSEWIQELKRLISFYLIDEQNEEHEDLWDCLNEFSLASRWIPDQKVSFISLKKHLETHLNRQGFIYRENHLQAVKFCSMLPMRAIPAKVIAILGMNENAFPRQENRLSLNLMKEYSSCDYCPERMDFDRYLFLEALLSVRQYFLISYTNYASNDGKEQAPSLLVTELFQYIDQTYSLKNLEKVSSQLKFKHPYDSFDFRYFSKDTLYKNFSQIAYRAAQSYYQQQKQPPHQFIHDFAQRDQLDIPSEMTLDIKQLKTAICDPIKSYFNSALGMYIKNPEENSEETFVVNNLQLHLLKQTSLKQPIETSLSEAEKLGQLPLGTFKKTAIQKIQESVSDYHELLSQMGVKKQDIYEIKLHEQYEKPIFDQSGWKLPPLTVNWNQSTFSIVGTLSEVTDKGLLIHIKGDKQDIIKAWVEFVIFNVLIDRYQLPIQKQLLCTKSGKIKPSFFDQPEKEFCQILEYYFLSTQNLSPLSQEWTHDLMHQKTEDFQNLLEDRLGDSFNPIRNAYIQWTCRTTSLNAPNMIEHWQPKAHQLFSNLYEAWID